MARATHHILTSFFLDLGTGRRRSRLPGAGSIRLPAGEGTGFGWISVALAWLLTGAILNLDAATTNEANSVTSVPIACELLEITGSVERGRVGSDEWKPARIHEPLLPGDRLRTLAESRATLRLSDRSVVRLHEWSVVEIQAPAGPQSAKRRLKLNQGRLFFLNRERPSDMEFETPLATGAIRGTEFLVQVSKTDGTTQVTLFDGAVTLLRGDESVNLTAGQEVTLAPGISPAFTAALPLRQAIQWTFYYPGILNPEDLALPPSERSLLSPSLEAYGQGALVSAFEAIPVAPAAVSKAWQLYVASLKLTIGKIEAAEEILRELPSDEPIADALRGLIAAVRLDSWGPGRSPATATEFLALSYYEQSRARLGEAREAARRATVSAPEFGFAWARLAELEFGFGQVSASREALRRARTLSPRQAHALSLEGFAALQEHRPAQARNWFDQAIHLDSALGSAWMGRGLAQEALGNYAAGADDLQTAAALEPQRAIFRSYLAKAWIQSRQDRLVDKEFQVAKNLDPTDPTAWLYSALYRHQIFRLNEAVNDLEHSVALNDNRRVFRSRNLLDADRSVRSANLAMLYQEVGLDEVGFRAARDAIDSDPALFSSHLFLSRSLQSTRDPFTYDLRLQTPQQSELLVANLLAPEGAGNLSQSLSQQEQLSFFEGKKLGVSTYSEYRSAGDGLQAASVFGQADHLSFAVDSQIVSLQGQHANSDLEQFGYSLQAKQGLTLKDSVYLQIGTSHLESGDIARHYDPNETKLTLRVEEDQNPYLYLGYHREWSPQSHTLLLVSRLPDHLTLDDPQPNVLFLQKSGGNNIAVSRDPFFRLNLDSEFTLQSTELQHLWDSDEHGLTVGARYQWTTIDSSAVLTRGPSAPLANVTAQELERLSSYAYYRWRPADWLRATAGLTFDHLIYPRNIDLPPILPGEQSRTRLSPKLGVTVTPWRNGSLYAAWTRSLGGVYFDDAVRLEPTLTAGFVHAFRSLIPESAAGLVPGTEFETWGVGLDQTFDSRTYAGVRAERFQSKGSREVGAFYNAGLIPEPQIPTSTLQSLDYNENNLTFYVGQLIGSRWSTGARYRISEAELTGRFPELPRDLPGVSSLEQDERAVLGNLELHVSFQHESGFFVRWESDWYHQTNQGYQSSRPGDQFWQHNAFAGWKFPRRHAEIRVGIINLTDQDYRLNPLNAHAVLARERTFVTSLRLNF
mgnify:CR=1 FL=1